MPPLLLPVARHALRWTGALLAAVWATCTWAAQPLPALSADRAITVSGLSSGGYAAVQYAVAFSSEVAGVGVVAGGPYDCADGSLLQALSRCACETADRCEALPAGTAALLSARSAEGKAALGLVDPLTHLARQRVWLGSGGRDVRVPRPLLDAVGTFYTGHVHTPRSHVRHRHLPEAGHGLPVVDGGPGVACGNSAFPFLNHCGVDAAGELLQWVLAQAAQPRTADAGRLREFDQKPHVATAGGETGLGDVGYVYVPAACEATGAHCRVHVAFHGCRQARDAVDDQGRPAGNTFAAHAGYNRWAEGAQLIVLYPQVRPFDTGGFPLFRHNPRACWDFWGYTRLFPSTGLHATNAAPQLRAVRAMVQALQRRP